MADIDELSQRVAPVALAADQRLPLRSDLEGRLPALRRGTVVEVQGIGATSLALAFAAGPSAAGAWVAAMALPSLGIVAASEAGVILDRFVLVDPPPDRAVAIVATLVDSVEVVLVGPGAVSARDARRLAARARERGSVIVSVAPWPDRAELRVRGVRNEWDGIGSGCGNVRSRQLTVELDGRAAAGVRRAVDLVLHDPGEGTL